MKKFLYVSNEFAVGSLTSADGIVAIVSEIDTPSGYYVTLADGTEIFDRKDGSPAKNTQADHDWYDEARELDAEMHCLDDLLDNLYRTKRAGYIPHHIAKRLLQQLQ